LFDVAHILKPNKYRMPLTKYPLVGQHITVNLDFLKQREKANDYLQVMKLHHLSTEFYEAEADR
jgi:hypothetical protein